MTVDQYSAKFPVNQHVQIAKGKEIVFIGTIKELQEYFYTFGQCEVDDEPYQLANTHYIKLK